MQPILKTSIVRPWHWGIVVLTDSSAAGDLPDVDPKSLVSASEAGLIVLIRHAQDIEILSEPDFAEGTVTLTVHQGPAELNPERTAVHTGLLSTPNGSLSVGDADTDVVVPAVPGITNVTVSVTDPADLSPDHIWVDLWPSDLLEGANTSSIYRRHLS